MGKPGNGGKQDKVENRIRWKIGKMENRKRWKRGNSGGMGTTGHGGKPNWCLTEHSGKRERWKAGNGGRMGKQDKLENRAWWKMGGDGKGRTQEMGGKQGKVENEERGKGKGGKEEKGEKGRKMENGK